MVIVWCVDVLILVVVMVVVLAVVVMLLLIDDSVSIFTSICRHYSCSDVDKVIVFVMVIVEMANALIVFNEVVIFFPLW